MILIYYTKLFVFCIFVNLTSSDDTPCNNLNQCDVCDISINKSITIQNCKDTPELQEHLNKLLADNIGLTSLTLENVALESLIPVCRLVNLYSLLLVNNNLDSIPTDCFNDFISIRIIWITSNKIKVLQKGTFEGLNTLEELILRENNIEHIDDEVFSNTSDLLQLKSVGLESNKLTTVGAWIFKRGIESPVQKFDLNLSTNRISKFTNAKNWTFTCKNKKKYIEFNIDFTINEIEHFSDVLNPYFKRKVDLLCMYSRPSYMYGYMFDYSFTMKLRRNSLICDCIDYQYIVLARNAPYANAIDDVQCKGPLKFQDKKLLSIPPEELICESKENCIQGCNCVEQPATSTFYIYCNNSYSLNSLPQSIPQTKLHKYFLHFGGNHIEQLESKVYFNKTVHLDISNSNIRSISNDFFISIKDIDYVYLHDNQLSSLPKEACLKETFSFKELRLYSNPWNCSCDNLWMKAWLHKSRHMLSFPEGIYCGEPYWNKNKNILTLDDLDFCKDPYVVKQNQILVVTLFSVFASFLIISVAGVLIWRFKIEIHSRCGIHPFDRDECEGENMIYDVFISASYQDRLFALSLVKKLENNEYRVCYHEKDFLIGSPIASNICRAVHYSKRVVCVLTDDFLKSPYCSIEFKTAYRRQTEIGRKRLITLYMLYDSVEVSKDTMSEEMYNFLRSNTYVELKDKWMNQLLYSLTVNKIKTLSVDCDFGNSMSELIPASTECF